ncbi:CzcA family heavy metal efflux pump [Haloferula luteola]|uniref:CzcA family heavy metal efflux pump n=1 Tax=Haloferula luteola TaxID=595692 RepID=A0A840V121_9BACT|nr:efflux RND transporter permease subunit [Haloferula luteola]MBB5350766.1 CzcA family heavy metal efflux pump [Haloferula luteola]
MLRNLLSTALRFRTLVLLSAVVLLAYGAFVAMHARLDVFPEFVPPQITVQTEAPGFSPEQVEALVTFPIESAIGGIPGLETTRSESIQGLSVVDLIFQDGSDELTDRQLLAERLTELAGTLPRQVGVPTPSPMVSSTMDLLKIGLVSDQKSGRDLRTLADWTVLPRLKAVPGVAEVTVVGGEVEELEILPQPAKMAALGVGLTELTAAARQAVDVRGSGSIETRNQRLTIHVHGPTPDVDHLSQLIVRGQGADAIRLSDLAEIRWGAMPKFGDALINGRRGVLLALTSQAGANTLETTRAVEQALDELRPLLTSQGIELMDGLHRPANFIEVALSHLTSSLLWGAVLVAVVLLLFLLDLRTAFISFISIPLSLLGAIAEMHFLGVPLNTMTLGGLAVAVGVVVDDAIIDVENILRRLRENASLPAPRPPLGVVLEASIEVRGAVLHATLIVLAMFVPVFALSGLQARFFQPLAISFMLAVVTSLVIAMTVTPALCLFLIGRARPRREPIHLRALASLHEALLRPLCRAPWAVIGIAAIGMVAAGILAKRLPTELLPPFREGHFVVQAIGLPGSSLEETMRFGEKASQQLLAMPEVASVEMQAGRSERGVDTWGPERCEFHIELHHDPNIDEAHVQQRIRTLFEAYGNMQTETLTFLGDRISESLSGETASVVVSLYGKDLDVLEAPTQQVAQLLRETPGAHGVQSLGSDRAPAWDVTLENARLEPHGLRPVAVQESIETAMQGTEVGQIVDANRIVPIQVRFDHATRQDLSSLARLPIDTPVGGLVPLSELGNLQLTEQRAQIRHQDGRRRQVVTANVEGRPVTEFVAEARQRIQDAHLLPEGVYLTVSGAAEAETRAHRELQAATAITLLVIGVFLAMAFRQLPNFLLVISILPISAAGGITAAALTGIPLSLGALIGLVTLFGLGVRNSIMLMSHYEHLVLHEGHEWNLTTAIQGARERLVPVLMTTAVTGLALLPLALHPTTAGREVEGPMAIVILGGLTLSTVVTLLILPVAAHHFARFRPVSSFSHVP